jgi:uncharacterized protein (TIGR03382 family)
MKGSIRVLLSPLLVLLALGFANGAAALVITYQATDLPNVPGPGDRWQYSYQISGGSFGAFGGFNVLFSPALYSNVQGTPPSPNPDWVVTTTPPFPPADALYTATALVSNPSLVGPFTVSFDWLGAGSPGSQPFEVFDETGFLPSEGGLTQAQAQGQVPLPGTLALLGLGLLALRARKAVTRTI